MYEHEFRPIPGAGLRREGSRELGLDVDDEDDGDDVAGADGQAKREIDLRAGEVAVPPAAAAGRGGAALTVEEKVGRIIPLVTRAEAAIARAPEDARAGSATREDLRDYVRQIDTIIGGDAETARLQALRERAWKAFGQLPTPNLADIPVANKTTMLNVEENLNTAALRAVATDNDLRNAAVKFRGIGAFLGRNIKHFYQVIQARNIREDGTVDITLVKTTNAFPSDRAYVKADTAIITSGSHDAIRGVIRRPIEVGEQLLIKGLTRIAEDRDAELVVNDASNWKIITRD